MGTPSKVKLGMAVISVGAAGYAPATEVGYTREGCEITWTPGIEEVTVSEEIMGITAIAKTAEVTVKCELAESTSANILKAIGLSADGSFSSALERFSLKVVGTSTGSPTKTITLTCLNGYNESSDLVIKRGDAFFIPLNFKALADINSGTGAVTYPTIVFA